MQKRIGHPSFPQGEGENLYDLFVAKACEDTLQRTMVKLSKLEITAAVTATEPDDGEGIRMPGWARKSRGRGGRSKGRRGSHGIAAR